MKFVDVFENCNFLVQPF